MTKNDNCWLCGQGFTTQNKKTSHHVLPLRFKPLVNITVPLHRECHSRIEGSLPKDNQSKQLKDIRGTLDRVNSILKSLELRLNKK